MRPPNAARRRRRRPNKRKMNPGGNDDAAASCPHPGFVHGLCFLCGAKVEDTEGVATGYIHDQEGPSRPAPEKKIIIPRASDLETLLRAGKLTLILDLDHTLLNSTGFKDLSPVEEGHGFTRRTRDDPDKGLFRLDSGPHRMLTKLRPFVRGFLEQASAMFEMYVYTLGDQEYAWAAAKLLDPDGAYFGHQRIVSSDESTRPDKKNLDVIPGAEPVAAVILDDSDFVWPEHQDNLILMDRYLYFASSCRKFGYDAASLAEQRRDEREHDGSLAVVLDVLKRVHKGFFEPTVVLDDGRRCSSDVREVIRAVRREVLRGCTVAFSRVIPLEVRAEDHRMWRLAEQLGAVCAADVDATVTHVVAQDPGTEKARWARENNKFLVNPNWIKAAGFRWCRPEEQDYPVTRGH